jgi:hypothetical protein
MHFIGDVHGKWYQYRERMRNKINSVQLGDFGVGFYDTYIEEERMMNRFMRDRNHVFIRGNHDNPAICRKMSQYVDIGTFCEDESIFFLGGGLSIDKTRRIEGRSWWPDEEMEHFDFELLLKKYEESKPRIVVSHECPEEVAKELFDTVKLLFVSLTREQYQVMLERHQPEYWIFAHWHLDRNVSINGTRFVCLGEMNEYIL